MANDREILREVWQGKLPVSFKLDPDEVVNIQEPDPLYLMVPRVSYFPLVTDKVKKHFLRYVDSTRQDHEMWLEYNGQPLKWHFPIGVLFDILVSPNQPQNICDALPWSIIVHFDKFPESQVYRFNNKEVVESFFMACVKEADVLKHRGQVVSGMQKKDHNQLWLGLLNDKFDQFWSVNRKLMELTGDQDHFKHIPFKCYMDDRYIQKLVKPVDDDGRKKTLADLIHEVFPDQSALVKSHGVEVPEDASLQWLSEHLSYPDNFLHLYCKFL